MSSESDNKKPTDRKATFSRRGLLQWSVPAILAVSLPAQVSAGTTFGDGHHDGHKDTHTDKHID